MSLNHREIDAVLSELDLAGAVLQGAIQPSYDAIVLEFYKPGRPLALFVSIAPGGCRLHASAKKFQKPPRPLRFMELLRSRLTGFRLIEAAQWGSERIVRLVLGHEGLELRLYAKLWSNAANIFLCDATDTIIDCMYRRPKRGEIGGKLFSFPAATSALSDGTKRKTYEIRDFPGTGSLSTRIESFYDQGVGTLSLEELRKRVESHFSERMGRLEAVLISIEAKKKEASLAAEFKRCGDLLLAVPAADPSSGWIETDDFFDEGKRVRIQVDPRRSAIENAGSYYERAKKATAAQGDLERQESRARGELLELEEKRAGLMDQTDPLALDRFLRLSPAQPLKAGKKAAPGILIERSGWTLIVGKSGKENDALLRRHVRGNDYWVHARDAAGAFVFIKCRAGKSPPLEVLLDAANLAVYHSKARASGKSEVHYTMVKYLRRVKDGPPGLVIPTQEKNLSVVLDEERLRRIKDESGEAG